MSNDTDTEQVELLKRFWKDYGQPAVLGLVITLAGVFGYQTWQKSQAQAIAAASTLYQDVIETVNQADDMTSEDQATIRHLVDKLQQDHKSSRYAALATQLLAKQQVDAGELEEAIKSFEWILAQPIDSILEAVVRIRLARVLLALPEPDADKALNVLALIKADKDIFVMSVESVKGDAYFIAGQQSEAVSAYQKALEAARKAAVSRPLIQLKLDDLAATVQGG